MRLHDDCAAGRDRENSCTNAQLGGIDRDNCTTAQQAGRKVRGYTMTTLPTGIYRDNCAAGRKRGSQLHDDGTADRDRKG